MAEGTVPSTIDVYKLSQKLVSVVARNRIIISRSPLGGTDTAVRTSAVIKCSVRITPNGYICLAVTVIIVLNIQVSTG